MKTFFHVLFSKVFFSINKESKFVYFFTEFYIMQINLKKKHAFLIIHERKRASTAFGMSLMTSFGCVAVGIGCPALLPKRCDYTRNFSPQLSETHTKPCIHVIATANREYSCDVVNNESCCLLLLAGTY
jgi:hypothetical protein